MSTTLDASELEELLEDGRQKLAANTPLELTEEEVSVLEELDLLLAVGLIFQNMMDRQEPTALEFEVLGWIEFYLGEIFNANEGNGADNAEIQSALNICWIVRSRY